MLTLKEKAHSDNLIMKILKVTEISHTIAKTSHGDLNLRLMYEGTENDYKFTLDAIPFEDKENKELLNLFEGTLYTNEIQPEYVTKLELKQLEETFMMVASKRVFTEDPLIIHITEEQDKMIRDAETASEVIAEDNTKDERTN